MNEENYTDSFIYSHLLYVLKKDEDIKFFTKKFKEHFEDDCNKLVNSNNDHVSYVFYIDEYVKHRETLNNIPFSDVDGIERFTKLFNSVYLFMSMNNLEFLFI